MDGRAFKQDVLDPFTLRECAFTLDFPSLQVLPSQDCTKELASMAETTILRLKLNDALCMKARWAYVSNYCNSRISLGFLRQHAPFIYREILRQG